MKIIEATIKGGSISNKKCDFCNEEPENKLLIEKPFSYILDGRKYQSLRRNFIYMCLDCFDFEYRECIMEDIEND